MTEQSSNPTAAVYVQSNDAAKNEVLAFERGADGALAPLGRFATGGRGNGEPHLPSQGSIVVTADGGQLLVVNAGSNVTRHAHDGERRIDRNGCGNR